MSEIVCVNDRIFTFNKAEQVGEKIIFVTDEIRCRKKREDAKNPYILLYGKTCFCMSAEDYKVSEWKQAIIDCFSRETPKEAIENNLYSDNYYFDIKPKDYETYLNKYPASEKKIKKEFSNSTDMYIYMYDKRHKTQ